jgi:YggT family protein
MPEQFISFLVYFVSVLSQLITFLIFARVIISWIPSAPNKLTNFIIYSSEPILAPFKKYVPTIGPIDISPIVCLLVISFIGNNNIKLLLNLA